MYSPYSHFPSCPSNWIKNLKNLASSQGFCVAFGFYVSLNQTQTLCPTFFPLPYDANIFEERKPVLLENVPHSGFACFPHV